MFVCANAYEKLGSMGARVCPVLSPVFTTLVNKTRQIYIVQIECPKISFLNMYFLSLAGKQILVGPTDTWKTESM